MKHLKYLVIGAGGTGGSIGAYMTEAGKDVTLIARGEHLKQMKEHGLCMETTAKGNIRCSLSRQWIWNIMKEQPGCHFCLL